jgi:DNA repair exonuclease SbcCD nuclease subunit
MKLQSKIGCFSDIHLGLGQGSTEWHDIALNFSKWAAETYKENGIQDIIIPGDIFHNRSHISVETLSVAKKFFDNFSDFNVYISTGNHDCFLKDASEINSISILNGWNNIHVVENSPKVFKTENDKTISLIPWGTPLEDIPLSDVMFGHFEISSFRMNSYKICDHGFSYKDLFKKAPIVISGHFHTKDDRMYEHGRIIYLGSPYQQNFGDVLDSRGIYVLDLIKNDVRFIENNISPKHYKISMTDDLSKDVIENNFISLTVENNQDENEILKIKSKIFELNPKNVRVDYDESNSKINCNDENKDFSGSDLIKNIEEYVESLDIENKKEVIDCIKELYISLS